MSTDDASVDISIEELVENETVKALLAKFAESAAMKAAEQLGSDTGNFGSQKLLRGGQGLGEGVSNWESNESRDML